MLLTHRYNMLHPADVVPTFKYYQSVMRLKNGLACKVVLIKGITFSVGTRLAVCPFEVRLDQGPFEDNSVIYYFAELKKSANRRLYIF